MCCKNKRRMISVHNIHRKYCCDVITPSTSDLRPLQPLFVHTKKYVVQYQIEDIFIFLFVMSTCASQVVTTLIVLSCSTPERHHFDSATPETPTTLDTKTIQQQKQISCVVPQIPCILRTIVSIVRLSVPIRHFRLNSQRATLKIPLVQILRHHIDCVQSGCAPQKQSSVQHSLCINWAT